MEAMQNIPRDQTLLDRLYTDAKYAGKYTLNGTLEAAALTANCTNRAITVASIIPALCLSADFILNIALPIISGLQSIPDPIHSKTFSFADQTSTRVEDLPALLQVVNALEPGYGSHLAKQMEDPLLTTTLYTVLGLSIAEVARYTLSKLEVTLRNAKLPL
jgi:hypothetical protein